MNLDLDSIKEEFNMMIEKIRNFFNNLPFYIEDIQRKAPIYFSSLTDYEKIAWGTLGLGFILFIASFFII